MVNNASAIDVQEVKPDRVYSVGSATIAPDGLPVSVDFSGCYGFGIMPKAGASWAGMDLSAGLTVAETQSKKTGATGDFIGAIGESINYWKVG